MRKACTYRIYPTRALEQKLFWTLARCRELYNAALAERKEAYRMAGKSISYYEQKRDLPDIKRLRAEYKDIHSQVLQDVLLRQDRAYKHFFRRVRQGKKPGHPRFQGRNRYDSFTYPQAGYTLTESQVTLSKVGTVKCRVHRPLEGTPKTCTVKYESGQWYVVFSCECADPEPLPLSYEDVGIDLGVTHFAALSDGTFIDNPRHYRTGEKVLQRRRNLCRERNGAAIAERKPNNWSPKRIARYATSAKTFITRLLANWSIAIR